MVTSNVSDSAKTVAANSPAIKTSARSTAETLENFFITAFPLSSLVNFNSLVACELSKPLYIFGFDRPEWIIRWEISNFHPIEKMLAYAIREKGCILGIKIFL